MFRGVALLDPVTASLERLPVTFDGDLQYPAWSRDGSLLAVGVSIRSSLWRFQAQATQQKTPAGAIGRFRGNLSRGCRV